MDFAQLKALIDSDPANAGKTDEQVLTWLGEGSGAFHERLINARTLMSELGAAEGAAFLEKLEAASVANAAVKWGLKFLTGSGLDVGNAQTRTMLDGLELAAVITAEERDGVKAMAVEKSRAEQADLFDVLLGHVEYARTL